jgi:hypothetical protein
LANVLGGVLHFGFFIHQHLKESLFSSSDGKGNKGSLYCSLPVTCSVKPAHHIRFSFEMLWYYKLVVMSNVERKKKGWEKIAMLKRFCLIHKFITLIDMHFFKSILNVVLLKPKEEKSLMINIHIFTL